eukprot:3650365-Amphidinium_carterae.3
MAYGSLVGVVVVGEPSVGCVDKVASASAVDEIHDYLRLVLEVLVHAGCLHWAKNEGEGPGLLFENGHSRLCTQGLPHVKRM